MRNCRNDLDAFWEHVQYAASHLQTIDEWSALRNINPATDDPDAVLEGIQSAKEALEQQRARLLVSEQTAREIECDKALIPISHYQTIIRYTAANDRRIKMLLGVLESEHERTG